MKQRIEQRAITEAEYIIKTKCTVREAARVFCISKSTIHKDVSERLKEIDFFLYQRVKEILETNLNERHIRGGKATQEKYKHL